jgi:hypothetical protein
MRGLHTNTWPVLLTMNAAKCSSTPLWTSTSRQCRHPTVNLTGARTRAGDVEVRACAEYGAGVDAGWAPPRRSTVDAGSAFVLVNDHDPKPLYYQLAAENAGEFSWDDGDQERCASRGLRRQHERTPSRP